MAWGWITIAKLDYIHWKVRFQSNPDGSVTRVRVTERRHTGGKAIIFEKSFIENTLGGDAARCFLDKCQDVLSKGSRSEMITHARNKGIEI